MSFAQGGLIFRSNIKTGGYYVFLVDKTDAHSHFYAFTIHTNNTNDILQGQFSSEGLSTTNTMTVVAYAHTFFFYLNKKFVLKAQNTMIDTGTVGVYSSTNNNSTCEFVFQISKLFRL